MDEIGGAAARALDRRQSASSLVNLIRDPLGYLWHYGFGWSAPEETDEPLTLDSLAFGNLMHETLQGAVDLLEDTPGGVAGASRDRRILVDEFQDTDPLQAEILWRLAGEGDPSQPWQDRQIRPGSLFQGTHIDQ